MLDDRIEVGRQHADALERALQQREIEASALQPALRRPHAPSSDSATIPDAGLDVLPAFTDSFELDVGDVPRAWISRPSSPLHRKKTSSRKRSCVWTEAKRRWCRSPEWIGGLKADVKPQLDAARQLGELAGDTALIVVVDDDAFQCKLLERLLGNSGYRSIIAHSGAEALAVLGRQPPISS